MDRGPRIEARSNWKLKSESTPPPQPSRHAAKIAQSRPPAATTPSALAKIVETQHQIQVRQSGTQRARCSLVAERLIADALGQRRRRSAFSKGNKLRYRAAAGSLTLPVGTEVPMEKALCLVCLRTGQVFRCCRHQSGIPDRSGRVPAPRHPVADRGSDFS